MIPTSEQGPKDAVWIDDRLPVAANREIEITLLLG